MHSLFGCLFVIIFGVFIVVFSLLWNVLRVFFHIRKTTKDFQKKAESAFNQEEGYTKAEPAHKSKHHNPNEKIFSKDEGEYVDFEEIKD